MFKSIMYIETTDRADTNLKNELFTEVEKFIMNAGGWTIKYTDEQHRVYENNEVIPQSIEKEIISHVESILKELVNSRKYPAYETIEVRYETTLEKILENDFDTVKAECDKIIKERGCFYYTNQNNDEIMVHTIPIPERFNIPSVNGIFSLDRSNYQNRGVSIVTDEEFFNKMEKIKK